MIVESNYAIAITPLSGWLMNPVLVFQQNQNQSHLVRVIFPALWATYNLEVIARNSDFIFAFFAPIVIGMSNHCFFFHRSFENRSVRPLLIMIQRSIRLGAVL